MRSTGRPLSPSSGIAHPLDDAAALLKSASGEADRTKVEISQSRLARIGAALTRHRPHLLIDLLLGASLLVLVASWIYSFSPVLALAIVSLTIVAYLLSLRRHERS